MQDPTDAPRPRCTNPASVRLEGYSPRDGRAHGSLDAIVHACPEHADEARNEWLSGLTPYATTPTTGARCGDRITFPPETADRPAVDEPLYGTAAREVGEQLAADRVFRMQRLKGGTLDVHCPPWCTHGHSSDSIAENQWHEADAILFVAPGDYCGHDDGGFFEALWACVSAQPDDETGMYGVPYIAFDTLSSGACAHLDVEQADAVLRDLRQYVDRLQQLRDQLAAILAGGGPR